MRSVGVLMRLMKACDMGCRNLFFCITFFKIKTLKILFLDVLSVSLMQSPWMERITTMNQLTDIRNNLKTNKKKNIQIQGFSDYWVRIGAFLY